MAHASSTRFRYTGRFLAFVPGKKSPYQKLLMQVVRSDQGGSAQAHEIYDVEVKLGKALRRMMVGYLEPYDWVRVVGKGKLDASSGQMRWKAGEILKLSSRQAKVLQAEFSRQLAHRARVMTDEFTKGEPGVSSTLVKRKRSEVSGAKASHKSGAKAGHKSGAKAARILICQKSDCRKRGSLAVQRAIEKTLSDAGCSKAVKIQPTGCMKHCKAGPNLVMLPAGDKYRRVTPKEARSLIKKIL